MQVASTRSGGPAHESRTRRVAFLARLLELSRFGVLAGPRAVGKSGLARSAALQCAAELRRGTGRNVVMVVFDQWDDEPLTALRAAIADEIAAAMKLTVSRQTLPGRTLADVLEYLCDKFRVELLIVLDQFDRNLEAEPIRDANACFTEQLAAAIDRPGVRGHFLVVIRDETYASLERLTVRLGRQYDGYMRVENGWDALEAPPPGQPDPAAIGTLRSDGLIEQFARVSPQAAASHGAYETDVHDPDADLDYHPPEPAFLPPEMPVDRQPPGIAGTRLAWDTPDTTRLSAVTGRARWSAGESSKESTSDDVIIPAFSANGQVDRDASTRIVARRRRERARRRWALGVVVALLLGAAAIALRSMRSDLVGVGEQLSGLLDRAAPAAGPAQTPPASSVSQSSPAVPAAGRESVQGAEQRVQPVPLQDGAPTRGSPPALAGGADDTGAPGRQSAAEATSAPPIEPPALAPDTPRAASGANAVGMSGDQDGKRSARPVDRKESPVQPRLADLDAPPGPPLPMQRVLAVPNPEREAMVFIHIRSESQRGRAREIAQRLASHNLVVTGIERELRGPARTDLRYYHVGESDEARYVQRVLARAGVTTPRARHVAGYEPIAVPRHYELWLAPD